MEASVYLKPRKEQSIERYHPWVFSGAIKRVEGDPQNGDVVTIRANKGRFLARGVYAAGRIAVRILSFEDLEVNDELIFSRLKNAWQKREKLGIAGNPNTNIFRWVHAEGDHLPGLIIDVYGDTAVVVAHALGMHNFAKSLASKFTELSNGTIKNVFDKSAIALKKHGIEIENSYLLGERSNAKLIENNVHFKVDWETGQKTGFFIDQRENRELLKRYSNEKTVVNTFCYTGGFSMYALQGGAKKVISVDSSASAMEMVEENVAWNHFDDKKHESLKADVLDFVKDLPKNVDVIVLDPPAFAKHMSARHQAVQGYKRINFQAIQQIRPGGIIFTFSCSQVIDTKLFRDTVMAAAINAKRNVRILHQLHQPPDHPINIYHPEGEYLKGLVLEVE
ncbi:MAG: class I SAM-dependent rRNA methyltransferase [Flavobacteriales bacterium]|nr:class I SAM-dependent rRNA methyltransferase [Flavobacteriales bacterium]